MVNNIELYGFLQGGWHKTEIIENGDDRVIYAGKSSSKQGEENLPIWCIKKITIANVNNIQTVVEQFADGDMNYDNIWADRATLNYLYT